MACGVFLLWATLAVAQPAQTFTSLHSFQRNRRRKPQAGLLQGTDGNLYATTEDGGASGKGTIFKITSSGTLTTLHSFAGTDGSLPWRGWSKPPMGLIRDNF